MQVGLMSDTHGDLEAVKRSFHILAGCDYILHAGDVLYHGVFNPILSSYSPKETADLINESPIPIVFARGNCDSEVDQLAIKWPILSEFSIFNWEGKSFLINHGDKRSQEELLTLAQEEKCHFVITGHTHIFGYQLKNGIYLINPGSPSLPKGPKIKTIAIISDKALRFINLKDAKGVLRAEVEM